MAGKLPEVRLANTPFKVVSPFEPSGDQPEAIATLAKGVEEGLRYQTLLGVTGSGKTFTMAKTIEAVQKPTLVMAPNKTLAAQLAAELKEFFPDNAVVYFVSYYDYYQPEAYVPSSDTFIEKDASINEEVEKLRHAATSASAVAAGRHRGGVGELHLRHRQPPMDYAGMAVFVDKQKEMDRDEVIHELIDIQYDRNDYEQKRGTFRVRGDALDVFPPYADHPVRIEFWGDEIESIDEIDQVTGEVLNSYEALPIWPASHYVTARPKMDKALGTIQDELRERLHAVQGGGQAARGPAPGDARELRLGDAGDHGLLLRYRELLAPSGRARAGRAALYAHRLLSEGLPLHHRRVPRHGAADPRHARGRPLPQDHAGRARLPPAQLPGQPPACASTSSRSAFHSSSTCRPRPGDYEEKVSLAQVEQVIRPTGLLDPEIVVRTSASQIDDIIDEAKERAARNERVLITTLTKKMAEDLTDHLLDQGVKARYMHSDIATLERTEILRDLRRGEFDVLVGINLLREGLDLPEVSLVAILDADKEGFLRNHRSLIQTIGRAARNVSGQVIMYADRITDSMRRAIDETRRRRDIQMAYNEEHGIKPQTIRKAINDIMGFITEDVEGATAEQVNKELAELSREEVLRLISSMEDDMAAASRDMDFEEAARLRDQVVKLKSTVEDKSEEDVLKDLKKGARKGSAYGNRKHAAYGSSRAS